MTCIQHYCCFRHFSVGIWIPDAILEANQIQTKSSFGYYFGCHSESSTIGVVFKSPRLSVSHIIKGLPYILAYKTKNFGQNLNYFFTIQLIRGWVLKQFQKWKLQHVVYFNQQTSALQTICWLKWSFWGGFNICYQCLGVNHYMRGNLYASIYGNMINRQVSHHHGIFGTKRTGFHYFCKQKNQS